MNDYLQLIWQGGDPRSVEHFSLQCFEWPRVCLQDSELAFGQPGYRDALCDLIGDSVRAVEAERGIRITLGTGTLLLDPMPEEVRGPEIALLHPIWNDTSDEPWQCCRPGEGVFAHLD